jgi:hypothetical protein
MKGHHHVWYGLSVKFQSMENPILFKKFPINATSSLVPTRSQGCQASIAGLSPKVNTQLTSVTILTDSVRKTVAPNHHNVIGVFLNVSFPCGSSNILTFAYINVKKLQILARYSFFAQYVFEYEALGVKYSSVSFYFSYRMLSYFKFSYCCAMFMNVYWN